MDRADAFFVQVDAVRIDVCDGRRGLSLGQLIRSSGQHWKADMRLRKRLGLNGASGSASPWLRPGDGRSGKGGPAAVWRSRRDWPGASGKTRKRVRSRCGWL